jgi:hypothetical protein
VRSRCSSARSSSSRVGSRPWPCWSTSSFSYSGAQSLAHLLAPPYLQSCDTIGDTCATLQQLLYPRTITISFTNNLRDRDGPMKKEVVVGWCMFYHLCHTNLKNVNSYLRVAHVLPMVSYCVYDLVLGGCRPSVLSAQISSFSSQLSNFSSPATTNLSQISNLGPQQLIPNILYLFPHVKQLILTIHYLSPNIQSLTPELTSFVP